MKKKKTKRRPHLLEQCRNSLVPRGVCLRLVKVGLSVVVVFLGKTGVRPTVERLARFGVELQRKGAIVHHLSCSRSVTNR